MAALFRSLQLCNNRPTLPVVAAVPSRTLRIGNDYGYGKKLTGVRSLDVSSMVPNRSRKMGSLTKCSVSRGNETGVTESKNSKDEPFVRFFRESWPYFQAHRGSIFVILIAAEIIDSPHLDPIILARFLLTLYWLFSFCSSLLLV